MRTETITEIKTEPKIETVFEELDHKDSLKKIINAVNSHDWIMAQELVKEWRNQIESTLLINYCISNEVDRDFDLLELRLRKKYPARIKTREIREAIANILDKISVYGLSIGRIKPNEDGQHVRIAKTLESLLKQIDREILKILIAGRDPLDKYVSKSIRIFDYLTALENALKSIKTEDKEMLKVIEHALSDIFGFKSNLYDLIKGKGKLDLYPSMAISVSKVARLLSEKDAEVRDVIKSVYEARTNWGIREGLVSPISEGVSGTPSPPPEEGEFDWIDEEWERILSPPKSILIIGHKGFGKSALGYAILEYYAKKHGLRAYLVNTYAPKPIPPEKLRALPEWITVVNNLRDVPPNSAILYDEAYTRFHARRTMTSESPVMDAIVELSRQKRHSIIWIAQESSKIDKNIVSSIDVLIIKNTTLFRINDEREVVKEYSKKALKAFSKIKSLEDKKKYAYVCDLINDFEGMKVNGLPSFWSDELSKFNEGW